MKLRPTEIVEEEEIEQIVDKKIQEIIAEGEDWEIMATTEIRKAIKEWKPKKQEIRIARKQNGQKKEAKWYRAEELCSIE